MSDWKLRIAEPGKEPIEVPLQEGLSFGRHKKNDQRLDDPASSGRHARVIAIDGALAIEDLGSANKTRIEGGPALAKDQHYRLVPGVRFRLGQTWCEVIGPPEPPRTVLLSDLQDDGAQRTLALPERGQSGPGEERRERERPAVARRVEPPHAESSPAAGAGERAQPASSAPERLSRKPEAVSPAAIAPAPPPIEPLVARRAEAPLSRASQAPVEPSVAAPSRGTEAIAPRASDAAAPPAAESAAPRDVARERPPAAPTVEPPVARVATPAAPDVAAATPMTNAARAAPSDPRAPIAAQPEPPVGPDARSSAPARAESVEPKAPAAGATKEPRAEPAGPAVREDPDPAGARQAPERSPAGAAQAAPIDTPPAAEAKRPSAVPAAAAPPAAAPAAAAAAAPARPAAIPAASPPAAAPPASGKNAAPRVATHGVAAPAVPASVPAEALGSDWAGGDGTIAVFDQKLDRLAKQTKLENSRPRLVVGSEGLRKILDIKQAQVVVGRNPEDGANLVIDDKGVSRRHAEITFSGSAFFIEELGSANRTHVAKEELPPKGRRLLASDVCVRFGTVDALFVSQLPDPKRPIGPATYAEALERLVRSAKITAGQKQRAVDEAARENRHAGEMLILAGAIDVETWADAVDDALLEKRLLGPGPSIVRRMPLGVVAVIGVLVLVVVVLVALLLWRS